MKLNGKDVKLNMAPEIKNDITFIPLRDLGEKILEKEVKEAPPVDYFTLISEVRRTGSNINQVLRKANAIGLIDVPLLRKALEENHATEDMLWQVFQSG